jgi:hypothetical protein
MKEFVGVLLVEIVIYFDFISVDLNFFTIFYNMLIISKIFKLKYY